MLTDFSNPLPQDFDFEKEALELFLYQKKHNSVLAQFCDTLNRGNQLNLSFNDILFLPVSFFKSQEVKTGVFEAEMVFTSSSTTGTGESKHFVKSLELYRNSFLGAFTHFYGNPTEYCFLCLLPSYMEREGSSLIYMANELVKRSKYSQSGFFLSDTEILIQTLKNNQEAGIKTILLGVTFALADMAEKVKLHLPDLIVMETGGMKGRRKEPLRTEIHHLIKQAFGIENVHSEYGMTELLSQAYSKGSGIFKCPDWMKIVIKDPGDPFKTLEHGKTGAVNIIDLANRDSCAFIATQDLGRTFEDGSFEILGRFDNSDLRGCNLLLG